VSAGGAAAATDSRTVTACERWSWREEGEKRRRERSSRFCRRDKERNETRGVGVWIQSGEDAKDALFL